MKKYMLIMGLLLISVTTATNAMAEIVIIASPGVDKKLTRSQVQKLFLGKGSNELVPVDIKSSNAVSKEFASKVLRKNSAQLKSYWSRLIFTGKGKPPKILASEDAVIKHVRSSRNAIGYVSAAKAGGQNVILRIK